MKEIKIDIDDVVSSGSVEEAIHEFCRNSEEVASGVVGPSFDCSGPGSGWQKNYDATDYAARALSNDFGALEYIDAGDGRVATMDSDGEVEWGDESAVVLVVPGAEDALKHPDALVAMVVALRDYHSAASDCTAWRELVNRIRGAAEKLEEVEL